MDEIAQQLTTFWRKPLSCQINRMKNGVGTSLTIAAEASASQTSVCGMGRCGGIGTGPNGENSNPSATASSAARELPAKGAGSSGKEIIGLDS
jgi:hypothetical protein